MSVFTTKKVDTILWHVRQAIYVPRNLAMIKRRKPVIESQKLSSAVSLQRLTREVQILTSKMGRKIPGKKHHGVKDPEKQQKARLDKIKMKVRRKDMYCHK